MKAAALDCLANTWVAFWGDSTTRLLFSALVDFLGGGIEDASFPTHDFSYKMHWGTFDFCYEGTRCHLAVHFPDRNVVLTFNFVTRLREYPDMWQTLAEHASSFREMGVHKVKPDIIVMNNGPWEYYAYGDNAWPGDASYFKSFTKFLRRYFHNETSGDPPRVVLLRNTACSQESGACEVSSASCVDAMDNVHRLQRKRLDDPPPWLRAEIRYVGGSYLKSYPEGYRCAGETSYHLPSAVTDQRLNHALYAMCG